MYKSESKLNLDSTTLTGRRVLLHDERADVPGHAPDAGRLAHVGPRVRVADVAYPELRAVADHLVLVRDVDSQRLIVLEPLHLLADGKIRF